MSYESGDFDRVVRFDNRLLGSVDNAPHISTAPTPLGETVTPLLCRLFCLYSHPRQQTQIHHLLSPLPIIFPLVLKVEDADFWWI